MTPFPRAQFLGVVASVLGVPPAYVTWKGTPEPSYMKPATPLLWASLRIGASSRVGVGWDDLRKTDNGDGTFTMQSVGRRKIVLGIECFTWDSTLAHDAVDLLDLLVTDIYQPDKLDTLNGLGLVIETNETILPLPTYVEARFISAAHVDLTVALAIQAGATFPGGNQFIGEVQGSGTVSPPTTAVPFDQKDR